MQTKKLTNLPQIIVHRILQNISTKLKIHAHLLLTRIGLKRYPSFTDVTIHNDEQQILELINHYIQRILPSGHIQQNYSITWKVPDDLSPLVTIIQLPYFPLHPAYNRISLVPQQQMKLLKKKNY